MSTNPNLLKNLTNAMVEVTDDVAALRVLDLGGGGGGGGGSSGIPVVDAVGANWLWFYDSTTGASTYISFATGAVGSPVLPVTPNSDTEVQVSNFPATQAVSGNVGITNTVAVTGPLTDTQLRATPVPVSGTVSVDNFPTTQAVSGPLTDTQLRATPVPVSGTVTANTGLSQPLTDGQLRATPVPVSGTFFQATQPVSAVSLPLPTGAATSENQTTANTSLANIDADIGAPSDASASSDGGTFSLIALTKRISAHGSSISSNTGGTNSRLGATGDAAATTDTGSFSILAFIKRGMQNWTTLLDRIPATQITPGLFPVDTLASLGTMRVQNTTATAASIVLTSTTRRVRATATQACIISTSTTATVPASGATLANAIALQAGESADFDVPDSTTLSVIRLGTTDGTVYVTELL